MEDYRFEQLCFNELTLQPLCSSNQDMYERVETYGKTIKEALQKLKTKHINYPDDSHGIMVSNTTSLNEFCRKYKNKPEIGIILTTYNMPQVNPDDKTVVSIFEDVNVSLTITGKERCSCGLAAAYSYKAPAIGFCSGKYWEDVMHIMHVKSSAHTQDENWPCLTLAEHLNQDDFKEWMQKHSKVELIESQLPVNKKTISLRDDHGKDVLKEHALKLCKNKYVVGVLTSLPFNNNYRKYISKVTPDGLIDIVLFWYDRGFSMRVKTTGRNIQETKAIADILEDEYSK